MTRLACSSGWNEARHGTPEDGLSELRSLGFVDVALGPRLSEADPARLAAAVSALGVRIVSLQHADSTELAACDARRRRMAVDRARRTIDTARALGAAAVQVLLGPGVAADAPDASLLACVAAHGFGSPAHRMLLEDARASRARELGPYFDAALETARALGEHARGSTVRIGVTSAAHFRAIPSVAELGLMLRESDVDYWHVTGAVHRQVWTGRWRNLDLLHAAGARVLGMSVHDARWDRDHLAPGAGDVDFLELGPFARSLVTLDVAPSVSRAELPRAIETLRVAGLA